MRRTLGLVLTVLMLAVSGCGDDAPDTPDDSSDTLTVLAAASLTEVFDGLSEQYDGQVDASYGSSTDLAEQAADGAPGDVLATADETSMGVAKDAGVLSADPVAFATNKLVIVTAPGNPKGVQGLTDLRGLTWVRCADDVPCGRVALELLTGGEGEAASLEPDVKSTLEKVTSGEADAGLVYASDAVAAGDRVTVVPIEGAEAALTTYYIAPLSQGDDERAEDWIDLVTSQAGQRALTDAGFTLP